MNIAFGEPCHANGWNWGGSSPDTHRYRNIGRNFGTTGMPYMRDKSCSAYCAALILAVFDIDDRSPDGTPFYVEDGVEWGNRAVRAGMVLA